jgi:hypothetical protein
LSYATFQDDPLQPSLISPLPLPRKALVVRIGVDNAPSISLFEKLGFIVTKRVEIFQEVELRINKDGSTWTGGEIHHVNFP